MVTANDFAYGIKRDPGSRRPPHPTPTCWGSSSRARLTSTRQTARLSDVGVKVVDDATLELTFLEAAAYNVKIAGLWVGARRPKWIIEGDATCTEARGERWTEPGFFQSYGPYTLNEWIHDSTITLVKNPFWPGTADIPVPKIDEVHFVDAG